MCFLSLILYAKWTNTYCKSYLFLYFKTTKIIRNILHWNSTIWFMFCKYLKIIVLKKIFFLQVCINPKRFSKYRLSSWKLKGNKMLNNLSLLKHNLLKQDVSYCGKILMHYLCNSTIHMFIENRNPKLYLVKNLKKYIFLK